MVYSTLAVRLSGGSIIDLDGTLFVQLALFLLAFLLLRALVFRPLLAIFDARDEATGGKAKGAEALQREAAELERDCEERVAQAKRDAANHADDLKLDGRATARTMVEDARASVDARLTSSLQGMEQEAARLRGDLAQQQTPLSRQIAEVMLGRGLS